MRIIILLLISMLSAASSSSAGALNLFSKKNKFVEVTELRPATAIPLTWLVNDTIVIGDQSSIYLYDIKRETVLNKVEDYYDASNFQQGNCFAPNASIYSISAPKIEKHGNTVVTSPPTQPRFRFVSNWQEPDKKKDRESAISWNTNPLDCTVINYEDRLEYIKHRELKDGFLDYADTRSGPLLKSVHGDSFLFAKKESNNTFTRYMEIGREASGSEGNPGKRLMLRYNNMPHGIEIFPHKMESYYDSIRGNYVLYETTREFDLNKGVWPLTAWRVTTGLDLLERIVLPPGPWVKKHSFLKQLSCFSCGCECYSHMKMFGGGGNMYIHVWGKAVDNDVAGVYRLENIKGEPKWARVYSGNFESQIIVSPDGSSIVLQDQNKKFKKIKVSNSNQ